MSGDCGPVRLACWTALDECGDCFELVLAALQPADVAACRLVSRGWRRHADILLQNVSVAAGTQLEQVADVWSNLRRLQLTASNHTGWLPQLDALPQLHCLRSLVLQGARGGAVPSGLDCRRLAPLAAMLGMQALEARDLLLHNAPALQDLAQLASLHLHACSLGEWPGTLPDLLLPLSRLSCLSFRAARDGCLGTPSLSGVSKLVSLQQLHLLALDVGSDATCQDIAALPHLASLTIDRRAGCSSAAPTITDAGVEALAGSLGSRLTRLTLTGHQLLTDGAVMAVAGMARLQHLDLRFQHWTPPREGPLLVTDEGLARLGALTGLQSLHLGGACALGELTCAMLAAHLPALTSLRITDCASLDDRAALRLQPLAGQLAQLALNNCEGVTDRSLERLLRKAARLSRLELAGCHRNITGLGLHMSGLCRLRYLNLACCDAITDAELERLLPAAKSLEHLDLSDCRVSDSACHLLASNAPNLQWLSLEHCPRVSRQGLLCLAAGLPLLRELHLAGSGVPPEAAAQLRASQRSGRLRIATAKHCWWVPPALCNPAAVAAH
ncbi:hypothetical protein D9Q98_004957 [Chlorella vulgaris]|uniref:F-box/LRR-repeat protein 15-like leucin rich repeat domain-containing protein n=1 Tax=Chlorella vulgaris TaxID=3077 RepID=A0A9D4YWN8_CHLVU|nr:hypothetical protein D9Q98_004957 [Chlorella vulgaris]